MREPDGRSAPIRGPGLRSRGNRVLLGVAIGFVAQIFAGLLDAATVVRLVVWALVTAIVYAVAAPRR